jgi:hypothetical protein
MQQFSVLLILRIPIKITNVASSFTIPMAILITMQAALPDRGDKNVHGNLFSTTIGASYYNPYSGKKYFEQKGGLYPSEKNERSGTYLSIGHVTWNLQL